MTSNNEYIKYYDEFSKDVTFAARSWHYYVYLQNRCAEDKNILKVLDKAARFWMDVEYCWVHTAIILLGNIFDNDSRSFNLDNLLKYAGTNKKHFSKERLRHRKIGLSGHREWLDEYIDNASELDDDDLNRIKEQGKKAKSLWNSIKPLRNKIYAHSDFMSDSDREKLFKNVKISDVTDIIQILLNISNALWEAENNGKAPDFSTDHKKYIDDVHIYIDKLISSLLPKENSK